MSYPLTPHIAAAKEKVNTLLYYLDTSDDLDDLGETNYPYKDIFNNSSTPIQVKELVPFSLASSKSKQQICCVKYLHSTHEKYSYNEV